MEIRTKQRWRMSWGICTFLTDLILWVWCLTLNWESLGRLLLQWNSFCNFFQSHFCCSCSFHVGSCNEDTSDIRSWYFLEINYFSKKFTFLYIFKTCNSMGEFPLYSQFRYHSHDFVFIVKYDIIVFPKWKPNKYVYFMEMI